MLRTSAAQGLIGINQACKRHPDSAATAHPMANIPQATVHRGFALVPTRVVTQLGGAGAVEASSVFMRFPTSFGSRIRTE